jgi:hypothetical protein
LWREVLLRWVFAELPMVTRLRNISRYIFSSRAKIFFLYLATWKYGCGLSQDWIIVEQFHISYFWW